MREHDLRKEAPRCPACGHLLDAATLFSGPDGRPEPGDLTVCISCTAFLTYGDGLQLHALSDAEYEALPMATQLDLRHLAIAIFRANKK